MNPTHQPDTPPKGGKNRSPPTPPSSNTSSPPSSTSSSQTSHRSVDAPRPQSPASTEQQKCQSEPYVLSPRGKGFTLRIHQDSSPAPAARPCHPGFTCVIAFQQHTPKEQATQDPALTPQRWLVYGDPWQQDTADEYTHPQRRLGTLDVDGESQKVSCIRLDENDMPMTRTRCTHGYIVGQEVNGRTLMEDQVENPDHMCIARVNLAKWKLLNTRQEAVGVLRLLGVGEHDANVAYNSYKGSWHVLWTLPVESLLHRIRRICGDLSAARDCTKQMRNLYQHLQHADIPIIDFYAAGERFGLWFGLQTSHLESSTLSHHSTTTVPGTDIQALDVCCDLFWHIDDEWISVGFNVLAGVNDNQFYAVPEQDWEPDDENDPLPLKVFPAACAGQLDVFVLEDLTAAGQSVVVKRIGEQVGA